MTVSPRLPWLKAATAPAAAVPGSHSLAPPPESAVDPVTEPDAAGRAAQAEPELFDPAQDEDPFEWLGFAPEPT